MANKRKNYFLFAITKQKRNCFKKYCKKQGLTMGGKLNQAIDAILINKT